MKDGRVKVCVKKVDKKIKERIQASNLEAFFLIWSGPETRSISLTITIH